MHKCLRQLRLFISFCFLLIWSGVLWGEEARITAENMSYDSKTGAFVAEKNVRIERVELLITAPRGDGNLKSRKITLSGGVHIGGKWEQEPVDLSCISLDGDLSPDGEYILREEVSGYFGTRSIDADELNMSKIAFSSKKVRKFEDSQQKIFVSAESVKGTIKEGQTTDINASGNVVIIFTGTDGQKTRITGSTATYSKAQDSLRVRGNAVALQLDRALRAEEILYSPGTGKMEASGQPQVTFQLHEKKGNDANERKDS
ncbi:MULTISPECIES: LptA/OstA family protein [Aminobacterium]|jgi:lipopolysaccharide export system protein LptA|uniref:LptA/OstA family protein n=1 Tax=Aminobacterium TaxID=81466 RepID=UPI00257D08D9|nr:LPS export ABC transporter periplasmic protein LptC [Aminobacterium sp. UBA4834]